MGFRSRPKDLNGLWLLIRMESGEEFEAVWCLRNLLSFPIGDTVVVEKRSTSMGESREILPIPRQQIESITVLGTMGARSDLSRGSEGMNLRLRYYGGNIYLSATDCDDNLVVTYHYFRQGHKELFSSSPTYFHSVEEAVTAAKEQGFEIEEV